jgi:predicted DCC family thiol-disulfide oxidoreductase YuxK
MGPTALSHTRVCIQKDAPKPRRCLHLGPQSPTFIKEEFVMLTRALYNADCPICNAEMCSYEAYSQKKELPIAFEDLNKIDLSEWGVTEDEATRLLHVIHKGQLYAGTKAFLILWEQMPRYRLLAKIGRLPVIYHIANVLYVNVVARIIYNRHLRRKARGIIQRS